MKTRNAILVASAICTCSLSNALQDSSYSAIPNQHHLSFEDQMKLQMSQKFARKMDEYLEQMEFQATVTNRKAKIRALQKSNFYNVAASFGYMTSIVLQIHFIVFRRDYATLGDVVDAAGRAIEDAAFDAEGFLLVKEINTKCLKNLNSLEERYNLEGQFMKLESNIGSTNYDFPSKSLALERENLGLDLIDFKREFQEKLACVLTSDTFAHSQRLLGLLNLYVNAANKRLDVLA